MDNDASLDRLLGGVWHKPWGHGLAEGERMTVLRVAQIGG